nr:MAG TPA: hypothetical protein [Caudoviricetes sp.]
MTKKPLSDILIIRHTYSFLCAMRNCPIPSGRCLFHGE